MFLSTAPTTKTKSTTTTTTTPSTTTTTSPSTTTSIATILPAMELLYAELVKKIKRALMDVIHTREII